MDRASRLWNVYIIEARILVSQSTLKREREKKR